ncbi:protoporphyrinogen oxidase [Candidatus Poriferisodalis sp.]|uniref:protoporphyrinogen oxidase n=1 Tax=Candidatus Poriferisodalis sp. TaxID=3101277 RepID=UPI003B5C287E
MAPKRVVVVGGGISGLTAAYRLLHPADAGTAVPRVVLIDSAERLGGKIHTTPFEGVPVDEGADAFLLRVPWAIELCDELGISAERISPSIGGASVVHAGPDGPQLTSLPDGLVGGVPTRLGPLLRSPLLGPAGTLRAAADYVLPRRFTARRLGPDGIDVVTSDPGENARLRLKSASVGDIVRSRLGAAVSSQVVDPLLGSISAGDTNRLDAAMSAPILIEALGRSRSLMRGLRRMQPAPVPGADGPAPIFGSFEGGMGRLVEALLQRLDGCILRLGHSVEAIRRPGTRFAVHTGSEVLAADAVIIAAPAHAAAEVLPGAPNAAAALARIGYASVAVTTLSVRPDAIEAPAEAGFLVTRDIGWLTTACSYGSAKWPNWSGGGNSDVGNCDAGNGGNEGIPNTILRVSVGRDDDDRHTRLSDSELLETVVGELSGLAPLRGLRDPAAITSWRVSRWERSLPQYVPGHGHLVERIESALARELPGVFVTGAAYRGLGIPACIRQGNEAAAAVVQHLGSGPPITSP